MKGQFFRQVLGVIIFSVAMGYLETAVVVYLREIYYPKGFQFPMVPIPAKTLLVELLREVATLVMLLGLGILAGKTRFQRFAYFLMAFGVWDLFYYIFLKMLLGWPAALTTPDILFLIPLPWVGPVWAPCVLSITMIAFGGMILGQEQKAFRYIMPAPDITFLVIGSLLVIFSFCLDPMQHLCGFNEGSTVPFVPGKYDWWWFVVGEGLILLAIYRLYRRNQ